MDKNELLSALKECEDSLCKDMYDGRWIYNGFCIFFKQRFGEYKRDYIIGFLIRYRTEFTGSYWFPPKYINKRLNLIRKAISDLEKVCD
jgi:hypothetical protein